MTREQELEIELLELKVELAKTSIALLNLQGRDAQAELKKKRAEYAPQAPCPPPEP